jgi:predicted lipoprotein with Yx(FWY)xxD motif
MRNLSLILASLAFVLLLLVGCGKNSPASSRAEASGETTAGTMSASRRPMVPGYLTIHVVVKRLPRLGIVLVNGRGRTLYAFVPDEHRAVTCTGSCATLWPAFKLSPSQALDSSPALSTSLVGTVPDPEGDRVVTFAGWPLYTYAGDTRAGIANGQGLNSHGGRWYAVSPSGALVMKER